MDAERLRSALAILNDALERPDAERAGFVDSACGGDAALAAEVRSLLEAHAVATGRSRFLEPPPPGDAGPDRGRSGARAGRAAPAQDEPRSTIGGYTILSLLGAGGMGAVYLAEQRSPRRRIALKVLAGPWTRHAIDRFALEAEALGRLRHPGIAAIYETGFDGEGPRRMPYLAMELVEHARPIDEHASRAGLDVTDRLRLFAQVCDAVHHGHLKGVVHRDLKPSNILVDDSGRAKVIDFGIARLGDDETRSRLTRTGALLGTPAYMSPEQCSGDTGAVDVRSDVYGLGAVLFTLLCGRPPIEVDALPLAGAVEAVRTRPPRRPRSLVPDLPRDVETIMLAALAKDPAERYASVAALADDIARFLADRPIEARPTTIIHSMRLFARRHRVVVAAASIVVLALVGATITSTGFAIAAARDRDEAERRRYVATLAAAEASLASGDTTRIRESLRAAPESLRGWEWRYLSDRAELAAQVIRAHEPRVQALAVLPGGSEVLSGGADGLLRRWDVATGAARTVVHFDAEPAGWTTGCTAAAVAPAGAGSTDAPVVAAADADGRVILLTLRRGAPTSDGGDDVAEMTTLEGAEHRVLRLRFSPSGSRLAASCDDGTICVWAAPSGALLARHRVRGPVRALHMLDDDRLVIGSSAGEVDLVSALDGAFLRCLLEARPGQRSAIQDIASIDDDAIAVASQDRTLRAIELADGSERFPAVELDKSLWSLAVSPDGSLIATGAGDRRVRVHEACGGTLLGEFAGHDDLVYALEFSPDGASLWSAGWDGTLRRWLLDDLLDPPQLVGHVGEVFGLGFSPTGDRLASGGRDGSLRIWDVAERRTLHDVRAGAGTVWGVAWQPHGSLVAAGCGDGDVILVDANGGTIAHRLDGHRQRCFSVAWRGDGGALVSGSADGTARLWVRGDDGAMRCEHVLEGHDGLVYAVAWNGSSSLVATTSWDRRVRLWDADRGAMVAQLAGHTDDIFAAAFSPDGAVLATGGRDRRVILWDVRARRERHRLDGHGQFVTGLAWLPDGSRLVGSSWFDRVPIWSPAPAEFLLGLRLAANTVPRAVAASPDGLTIATGSVEGPVALWVAP